MLPHTPVAVGHCPFSRNLFSELLLNKGQSPCQKQQPAWLLILIVPSPPWNGRTAQSHSWSRLLRRTSSSFWLVHEDRSFFTALVWWVCARYICTHRVHTTSRCRISAWRCVHSMGVDPWIVDYYALLRLVSYRLEVHCTYDRHGAFHWHENRSSQKDRWSFGRFTAAENRPAHKTKRTPQIFPSLNGRLCSCKCYPSLHVRPGFSSSKQGVGRRISSAQGMGLRASVICHNLFEEVMCNSSRQIFQEKRMLCAGLTSLK